MLRLQAAGERVVAALASGGTAGGRVRKRLLKKHQCVTSAIRSTCDHGHRRIREVRIAGTYNFDLMLEVPSALVAAGPYAQSVPVEPEIKADVFLIGVVRHVYRRGQKGFIIKVPETENDQVYEQVLLKVAPDTTLWTFRGEPYIDRIALQEAVCKVKVVANRDDASFILEDGKGRARASGNGKDASLDLAELEPAKCRGRVVFLPVLASSEKTGAQVFEATSVTIDASDKDAPILVKGEYLPRKTHTSPRRKGD